RADTAHCRTIPQSLSAGCAPHAGYELSARGPFSLAYNRLVLLPSWRATDASGDDSRGARALFLAEFPRSFYPESGLTIEAVWERGCRVRQAFRQRSVRPGDTISGPTMMALADF